jgi:putative transposase
LMLAKDPKYLHALTGLVAVLHTWGQNLMEHPHLHTIVPAGGWSEMAQCWKFSRKKFFMPVKVISAVFKGKFLSLLKAAYTEGELKFEGEIRPLQLKNNFKQLLNILYNKQWVVYAKKPFKNAQHILNYLGRYTHRVAIVNNRIVRIENDHVIFKWKDYKDRSTQKIMKLPAAEFIRRFLLHVLPKGFCKIRYYGIFASRVRKPILKQCSIVTGHEVTKSKFAGLSWQQSLLLACGIDVCLCPVCKNGKMQTALIFKSNKAPPDALPIVL